MFGRKKIITQIINADACVSFSTVTKYRSLVCHRKFLGFYLNVVLDNNTLFSKYNALLLTKGSVTFHFGTIHFGGTVPRVYLQWLVFFDTTQNEKYQDSDVNVSHSRLRDLMSSFAERKP